MKKESVRKLIFFILAVIIIIILDRRLGLVSKITDPGSYIRLRQMTGENFFMASSLYIGITVLSCVLLALPGVTFAAAAAYLFGPLRGTILCLIGVTLGAIASFLVGRYFLKDSVKPLLNKNATLKKLLFSEDSNSFFILLMITRLLPIFPYNIQNFAYGITDISLGEYSLYTFLFLIPGVTMFTLLTAGLTGGENSRNYIISSLLLFAGVIIISALIRKRFLTADKNEGEVN